ncbi:hypothetical protein [Planktothrix pseudagardhii]|uniref:Uncharacterized protein n=1 Tax=Planktothrix pseudagardhii TaxID=132604 RepID=A0A9W4CX16_9CYAN|nr:hypothetical protein [Planktothrix pseudagardhii]CAD5912758.1 hypothetical protein NO713_00149 [Planktothrix pseudagardhii]
MRCLFCPYQLHQDKTAAFQQITDIIHLLDSAQDASEDATAKHLINEAVDRLYDLRIHTNNSGTCVEQCSLCPY